MSSVRTVEINGSSCQLVVKRVRDLEPREYVACEKLTKTFGTMRATLKLQFGKPSRMSKVIILYRRNTIVGWSLLFCVGRQKPWHAYFYVAPRQRCKGYGTLLLNEALRRTRGTVEVYPDTANYKFFEKNIHPRVKRT